MRNYNFSMDSSKLPQTPKRINFLDYFRLLFPLVYIALLAPLAFPDLPLEFKLALFLVCFCFGLLINAKIVKGVLPTILASLATLTPFIGIVQWAKCSSFEIIQNTVSQCVITETASVLVTFGLGTSVFLLAVTNEWRGSLLNSINGLRIPRSVRTISIVGSVLIGEFRKTMARTHLAFSARGQAYPSLHWRNFFILPAVLGCVWSAVLKMSADRLDLQWSSQTFWDKYIPHKISEVKTSSFDLIILLIAFATIAFLILSMTKFYI